MIRINLLPKEIEKKAAVKERIILAGIAGVLVLLIFFGIWFLKFAQVKKLEKEVRKLDSELKKIEDKAKKVDEVERNKKILSERLKVINSLLASRLDYPKLMETITRPDILPPRVWITGMSTKTSSDKIEITFQVQALDNYAIADFLTNLDKSRRFENVELSAITTTKVEDTPVRTFSIKCFYKPERGKNA
ncbi:MAG: hypothetical protein DRI36_01450 [Caldiserica bacterium]|nr:MAG: hypothetical protein DRI36_01450 [Caldisericota bacterium]